MYKLSLAIEHFPFISSLAIEMEVGFSLVFSALPGTWNCAALDPYFAFIAQCHISPTPHRGILFVPLSTVIYFSCVIKFIPRTPVAAAAAADDHR